jgi:protein required for attachment to host cells
MTKTVVQEKEEATKREGGRRFESAVVCARPNFIGQLQKLSPPRQI